MSRRKEPKEETPTASLPLKITHVFGSAARRPFQGLIGAALFSKNFPDFINAPELRSGFFRNIASLVATPSLSPPLGETERGRGL